MPDPVPTPASPAPTPAATPAPIASAPTPPASADPVPAAGPSLAAQPAPTEPPPPAPTPESVAPLAVTDIKLPEGLSAEDPAVADFLESMNSSKVGKEGAQKLLERHAEAVRKAAEAPLQAYKDINARWVSEIKADPELGDPSVDRTIKPEVSRVLSQAIDRFGGDKLREALDLTGAGNNPAVVRAFYEIGKLISEPTGHVSGNPPAQPKGPPPAAHALYPNLVKEGN